MCRMAYIENPGVWPSKGLVAHLDYLDKIGGGQGIGVGWIDKETNTPKIVKSLDMTPDEAAGVMLGNLEKAKLGFIFHSRIATVGDKCDELCMPFPFNGNSLFAFNGTWSHWREAFYAMLGRGLLLPPPPMVSDALVAAAMLGELGLDYWTLIDTGVILIMTPEKVMLRKTRAGDFAVGKVKGFRMFASRLDPDVKWGSMSELEGLRSIQLNVDELPEQDLKKYTEYTYVRKKWTRGQGNTGGHYGDWYGYDAARKKSASKKSKKQKKREKREAKQRKKEASKATPPSDVSATQPPLLLSGPLAGTEKLQMLRRKKNQELVNQCVDAELTFNTLGWEHIDKFRMLSRIPLHVSWMGTSNERFITIIPKSGNHLVVLGTVNMLLEGRLMFYITQDQVYMRRKHWKLPIWIQVAPAEDYDLEAGGGWTAPVVLLQNEGSSVNIAETLSSGTWLLSPQTVGRSVQSIDFKQLWDNPPEWHNWFLVYLSEQLDCHPQDYLYVVGEDNTEASLLGMSLDDAHCMSAGGERDFLLWQCQECNHFVADVVGECPRCGHGTWTTFDGEIPLELEGLDLDVIATALNHLLDDEEDRDETVWQCKDCDRVTLEPCECETCSGLEFKPWP